MLKRRTDPSEMVVSLILKERTAVVARREDNLWSSAGRGVEDSVARCLLLAGLVMCWGSGGGG